MRKKFYKWCKLPPATCTMIEVTKDYFAEDDPYINPENGWVKIEDDYIEVEVDE